MATVTSTPPSVPTDSDPMNNLNNQVNTYNTDYNQLLDLKKQLDAATQEIDDAARAGNENYYLASILKVFGLLLDYTAQEQKLYGDKEGVESALNGFGTADEGYFEEGSTYVPATYNADGTVKTPASGGMTTEDAQKFINDQNDEWWALNATSYTDANGNVVNQPYLWMLDDNTKSQLSDTVKTTMAQYGVTNPNNPESAFWNAAAVQGKTNQLWGAHGADGAPPTDPVSSILGAFQQANNTCSGAEQSASSYVQTWGQYENTYMNNEEGCLQSIEQETSTEVHHYTGN
jgi:hypothetical protein